MCHHHIRVITVSVTSDIDFFVMRTFKILSCSYIELYSEFPPTGVTPLCCRALALLFLSNWDVVPVNQPVSDPSSRVPCPSWAPL